MKNNEDTIDPNNRGEIYLDSPFSVGQNFDFELYNWQIKNYEAQARGCLSIKEIP